MNEILYNMIFKRKSFHLFRNTGNSCLTEPELEEIMTFWQGLTPLCLKHQDIAYTMEVCGDDGSDAEWTLAAIAAILEE